MLDLQVSAGVAAAGDARDLSIAVPALAPEELGDARDRRSVIAARASGDRVLNETPYADLSPVAREQLGIGAGQKNVLCWWRSAISSVL
jgi:hypothetical protein